MLQISDKLYNFTTNKCTICEDYCQSICLNIVTACFRSSCFVVAVRVDCSVPDGFLPLPDEHCADGFVALRSGRTISQKGKECCCSLSSQYSVDGYIYSSIGCWLYRYGTAEATCYRVVSISGDDTLCSDATFDDNSARMAKQRWREVALSALSHRSAAGACCRLLGRTG